MYYHYVHKSRQWITKLYEKNTNIVNSNIAQMELGKESSYSFTVGGKIADCRVENILHLQFLDRSLVVYISTTLPDFHALNKTQPVLGHQCE